ncbi:hypothetical protein ANO11243_061850 [Dothideomycetidae sp. 11243]|nr:hypothetical protein ANO11243_061850 [fungal sp. No.11243]
MSSLVTHSDDGQDCYNLGSFQRKVTTCSAEAQVWFNRGLTWSYGFNHEESAACFERAIKLDRDCGMAYWGLAYALGPNYNKPWDAFDEDDRASTATRAHRSIARAARAVEASSPIEAALIKALSFRYPPDPQESRWNVWNRDYAEAMATVYAEHGSDLDVAALYADSLMNLTPWKLWDVRTGKPAKGASTILIKQVLERAMSAAGGNRHPGVLHLYIHLMEMGNPEEALVAADNLRDLVPDAGHLQHMPTHIDVLCGHFQRAIDSNSDAIRADEKFLARSGPMNFYTLYRLHDFHFRLYAAMFAGQKQVALDTVGQMEASLSADLLRVRSPPMADWLEGFLSMRVHVLVRFGMWEELINLELPADPQLYCVTTAMLHYGKCIAYAATGQIASAEEQTALFRERKDAVPPSRTLFNNTCCDILRIAASMVAGETAYRKGDVEAGFAHLRTAVTLDDALPYEEPWGWMQPVRHALGALLLEQGRLAEALDTYAADLGISDELPRALRHPNNVWALHGYHEALYRLGHSEKAHDVGRKLRSAMNGTDVPITTSCLCRRMLVSPVDPKAQA